MYRALARKYRPQNLNQLVGQNNLITTLTNAFNSGQVPSAILLHGIRGVGKTTTARIIAKCLNCLGASGIETKAQIVPCDQCKSCLGILQDRHMDVCEIDAASHTSVDEMRELTQSAQYKAIQGRFKVFIIDEVHMLSKAAFNALLKTLEEPPPHVKFILATTEINKIPETILSRCMRFDLQSLTPNLIIKHLNFVLESEKVEANADALALLARAASGSMRDALSLMDQALVLSNNQTIGFELVQNMLGYCQRFKILELIDVVFKAQAEEVLNQLGSLYQSGNSAVSVLNELCDSFYWLICVKQVPRLINDCSWPENDRMQAAALVANVALSSLIQAWDILIQSQRDLKVAPDAQQFLDIAILRLMMINEIIGGSGKQFLENSSGGGMATTLLQAKPFSNNSSQFNSVEGRTSTVTNRQPITFTNQSQYDRAPSQLPQDAYELLALALNAKEIMLHSYLYNDVKFVIFKPLALSLILNKRVPKNFVKLLNDFLLKATNSIWQIEILDDNAVGETCETLYQSDARLRAETLSKVKEHPLMKDILKFFPQTTIDIAQKH